MTKLQEVARAIDPEAWPADRYSAHWGIRTVRREASIVAARAAIEAMRQPTPDMYHAAVMTHVHENGGIEHSPDLSWKAMIDAILSEGE